MQPCLATQATHVNARTHFQPSNQLSHSHRLPSLTDTFEKSKPGLMMKQSLHTKGKAVQSTTCIGSGKHQRLQIRLKNEYQVSSPIGKSPDEDKIPWQEHRAESLRLGPPEGWLIFDSLNRQRIQIQSADTLQTDRQTEQAACLGAGCIRAGFGWISLSLWPKWSKTGFWPSLWKVFGLQRRMQGGLWNVGFVTNQLGDLEQVTWSLNRLDSNESTLIGLLWGLKENWLLNRVSDIGKAQEWGGRTIREFS